MLELYKNSLFPIIHDIFTQRVDKNLEINSI